MLIRYSYSTGLLNLIIKKQKTHNQLQKQRLVARPEQGTCLSFPAESTSCGNDRPLGNKK